MAKHNYTLESLKNDYQRLYNNCYIKQSVIGQLDKVIARIFAGKQKYDIVSSTTGVPWYFVGLIHSMECDCNFQKHLHNGNDLSKKTTDIPVGRPKIWPILDDDGSPSWTASAIDAMKLKALDKWTDWSVPAQLYLLEKFNGFGYRPKGINSPYLWSGSNHYVKGKYVADKEYDSNAVSKQIGVALIIKRLIEKGL